MNNLFEADLIFVDGNVLTMNTELPNANSIVVKDGTVLFIGEKNDALTFRGKNTEIINLEGKTAMPGFIESHIHPTIYGLNLLELDCRKESTQSIAEILKVVGEATKNIDDDEWIRGWGWDDSKLIEKRMITRQDLDKVAPNHPVILKRTCGHMSVVNTRALELSNITKDTKDPSGGHLERNAETGEFTGLLQEKAQGLVSLPEYISSDIVKGMKLAQKDFAKWGITTVHDMSAQPVNMQVYQNMINEDSLKVRVRPWMWAIKQNEWVGLLDEYVNAGIQSDLGNDMLKIQGMKFMLDGSVGGRTAAVSEVYENEDTLGILYSEVDDIAPSMQKAIESGLRVAIHGIGERAIEVAIKAFEIANETVDITGMRNRIEHCALPTNDHLKRMKTLELMAGSSIGFLHHIGDSYLANLGPERMKRVYPHKSFIEHGIIAPGNSDLPVTGGNPWTGISAAVTRTSISGQVLDETQNISVMEAIKAYTNDAAYSSFEEQTIGVIKASAKADIIIVSEDPFSISPDKLKDIKVEQTFMNGELVFSN